MRFLVDCCAAARRLAKWLWNEGHDVFDAGELEHDPGDVMLLAQAAAKDRVLITLDNHFGELLDAADAGLSVSEAETALTPASDPACWPARAHVAEYCRRKGDPGRAGRSRRTPDRSGHRASEPLHRYA